MRPNTSVVRHLEHEAQQPGQHQQVDQDVGAEAEERVPVARRPQRWPVCRRCRQSSSPPSVVDANAISARALGASAASSSRRIRHPAEDAALRRDHREARFVELREIGGAAVGEHDAAVAAIVGLAHRGVDADLGGDAADDQRLDAAIAAASVRDRSA